jgi:hypothetical protein
MGMDMPMATDTNTTSTRFSAASIVAGMVTPALSTSMTPLAPDGSYHAVPPGTPQFRDLFRALEISRDIVLQLGSAWDALPGATRKPLLDHAHELIDLVGRVETGVAGNVASAANGTSCFVTPK